MDAGNLIQKLQLQPHPEGGFYQETYRSEAIMTTTEGSVRNVSTAIYFLLENDEKSHFHRIKSDEAWFFHQGESIEIVILDDGKLQTIVLGNNLEKGEVPQAIVPANVWFASRIKHGIGYALVSCTVAPGFDFADFELARRNDLITEFPEYKSVIEEFTR
jgi:predicted cupin superfamily sugar epimerase